MGGLCLVGGLTGFARTRSMPSLVAGVRYAIDRLVLTRTLSIIRETVALVYCSSGVLITSARARQTGWKAHFVRVPSPEHYPRAHHFPQCSCSHRFNALFCAPLREGTNPQDAHHNRCCVCRLLWQNALRSEAIGALRDCALVCCM